MPAFRRVEPRSAGPSAIGILVPQGKLTLLVLRARALPWDLLAAQWNGRADSAPAFCQFFRDEAATIARRLPQAFEAAAHCTQSPVSTVSDSAGTTFQIWLRALEFVFIACRRAPGKLYEPIVFLTHEEAVAAGKSAEQFFWPSADANQEFYFNTQYFAG
ncbi:MAG: hypothetical protein L0Y72_10860 [Gemmataceae bacterium]|nr:hypothetical protein [Gemmataceae bacterium]MCI0739535.1 hypothetical protein [Gemmataceae bacterium]